LEFVSDLGFRISNLYHMDIDFSRIAARIKGVSLVQKVMFTRNLALVVKAGMSLPQGLDALSKESDSPLLKLILGEIKIDVNQGKEFSQALTKYTNVFDPFYISMVKTGEASGSLEEVLSSLATHMEKDRALRSKVISALIYPAVILVVMTLVLFAMMVFVVPRLTQVFASFNAKLPITTRLLIATSNFMVDHVVLLLVGIVVGIIGLWYFFRRTAKGKVMLDWFILHTPVFKTLSRKINTARIARTLQTLVKSGIPILSALNITHDVVQNSYYQEMLLAARRGVEKGKSLNEILKEYPKLYPPLATQLITVGEETGALDLVLTDLAEFYEQEVDTITKNLSSIIEPVLMVLIGSAVGFLAISMLQPIYSLTSSIG